MLTIYRRKSSVPTYFDKFIAISETNLAGSGSTEDEAINALETSGEFVFEAPEHHYDMITIDE